MRDWLRRRSENPYRVVLLLVSSLLGFLYGSQFVARFEPQPPVTIHESQSFLPNFVVDATHPPILGLQNKSGIVPAPFWRKGAANVRQNFFDSWLFQYIHHNRIVQPTLPYPHCQVYINHDYKFIWIKGHKVGSTAFRGPLGWLCDDHWMIPENASFDHCSQAMWSQPVNMNTVMKQWQEYFVFGAVRNPYERFASAYEYIKAHAASNGCEAGLKQLTFGDICNDPYLHTVICASTDCWCAEHHFRHFMPQAPCLLTESLLPAVDYIADVSNLDHDLEVILATINERREKHLPPLRVLIDYQKVNTHEDIDNTTRRLLTKGRSGAPEYVERLYAEYPECLERVGYYFHLDFLMFGYKKHRDINA